LLAYAKRTQLKSNTPNSINTLEKLNTELEAVRKNQTARDKEELEIGVSCMAAAIYDDAHQVIAGLSISAPAHQLQDSWLEPLRSAAHNISQAMGDMTE
jgi:DNA-binding IclR family transcriptional regulator